MEEGQADLGSPDGSVTDLTGTKTVVCVLDSRGSTVTVQQQVTGLRLHDGLIA